MKYSVLALCLVVASCSHFRFSPDKYPYYDRVTRKNWIFQATYQKINLQYLITITVNGYAVTGGVLHDMKPWDNFYGNLNDKPILAECELVYKQKYDIEPTRECFISVENEKFKLEF